MKSKNICWLILGALTCLAFTPYYYTKIPKRSYNHIRVFDLKTSKNYPLETVLGNKLTVVVFHSAHCPFNDVYHAKLDSLSFAHIQDSLQVIYINSNSAENSKKAPDSLIVNFSKQHKGFYILDTYRTIENLFNRTSSQKVKNSTVFLCKQLDTGIKTYYSGPIDDSPQQNQEGKPYLENAISRARQGKTSKNEVINTGCRIVNH